jgi:hypothetical protein
MVSGIDVCCEVACAGMVTDLVSLKHMIRLLLLWVCLSGDSERSKYVSTCL